MKKLDMTFMYLLGCYSVLKPQQQLAIQAALELHIWRTLTLCSLSTLRKVMGVKVHPHNIQKINNLEVHMY